MIRNLFLLTVFTFLISGCSSLEVKDWLKEGTKKQKKVLKLEKLA